MVTAQGMDAIRRAAPDHVASVRRHLIDLLSPEQIAALTELGETVIAHFGEKCQNWAAQASADCTDAQVADVPGQSANESPESRSYAST